jgi:hypothetical protein
VDVHVDDKAKSRGVGRGDENGDLLGYEEDPDDEQHESADDSPSEPLKPLNPAESLKPEQPPQPTKRKPREWLSWSWLSAIRLINEDQNRSDEDELKLLSLRRAPSLRSPSPQVRPAGWRPGESPDVTVIENLIADEGGSRAAEEIVLLAWCEFCFNFQHDPKTLYPVTVFEANYDTFRTAAVDTCRRVAEERKQTEGMVLPRLRVNSKALDLARDARKRFIVPSGNTSG